MSKVRRW